MSANNRRAWTPDVIETMRALAASGKGCRLIGRALGGIPKSTVKEACARFGIALSRLPGGQQTTWTPDADAELARMWKAGHSSYALADHFGRARKGIANRIKRLGLIGCMRAAPIKGPLTAHMPGDATPRRAKRDPGVKIRRARKPGFPNATIVEVDRRQPTTGPETREPRGCRWIDGDVRSGDWRYCQAAMVDGSSYCAAHAPRTTIPGTAFIFGRARGAPPSV